MYCTGELVKSVDEFSDLVVRGAVLYSEGDHSSSSSVMNVHSSRTLAVGSWYRSDGYFHLGFSRLV